MIAEDLTGAKFGELLVVQRTDPYIHPNGRPRIRYLCVCSCGKTTVVRADYLKSGHTVSCGTCKAERTKKERELEKQTAERREKEFRPKPIAADRCCFYPFGVLCYEIECATCGWNPRNKELRRERVEKVIAKWREEHAGKNCSAAEDSPVL